jgi:hypothetical protein
MHTPDGKHYKESNYNGYGVFGGKDYFVELSVANPTAEGIVGPQMEETHRERGIEMSFGPSPSPSPSTGKVQYPVFTETPEYDGSYDKQCSQCEFQGYFYFDDDEEEEADEDVTNSRKRGREEQEQELLVTPAKEKNEEQSVPDAPRKLRKQNMPFRQQLLDRDAAEAKRLRLMEAERELQQSILNISQVLMDQHKNLEVVDHEVMILLEGYFDEALAKVAHKVANK